MSKEVHLSLFRLELLTAIHDLSQQHGCKLVPISALTQLLNHHSYNSIATTLTTLKIGGFIINPFSGLNSRVFGCGWRLTVKGQAAVLREVN